MRKKAKRDGSLVHELAPGEKKKLSDWLREENQDRKAFPHLVNDGRNGLYDKNRKRKLSASQNYSHKILNKNKKFAEDSDFIFVAQQYLERYSFENQASVLIQRGVIRTSPDGSF